MRLREILTTATDILTRKGSEAKPVDVLDVKAKLQPKYSGLDVTSEATFTALTRAARRARLIGNGYYRLTPWRQETPINFRVTHTWRGGYSVTPMNLVPDSLQASIGDNFAGAHTDHLREFGTRVFPKRRRR